MSKPDLMTLAEEERTDLLALLHSPSDEQWNAPAGSPRGSAGASP
jgi:hypothetical protein